MGVNRADLNDFVGTLNLNAANIDDFMADPELVKGQIEKYYENMNQLPF